ncbi:BnaA06g02410D [Brassica napus]|uniref:BnaA06g02410D protein n=2 Tax=Brassica napus TaxID=3708 RepID=A0A078GBT0_BRANA|nr:BnaA06g02410D [Brassica napus]
MMRRKMKAWKKKEKGVEVSQEVSLEKSLVFFEKPKFDSISKVKGPEKKLELC